jgi:hypothetical protein
MPFAFPLSQKTGCRKSTLPTACFRQRRIQTKCCAAQCQREPVPSSGTGNGGRELVWLSCRGHNKAKGHFPFSVLPILFQQETIRISQSPLFILFYDISLFSHLQAFFAITISF